MSVRYKNIIRTLNSQFEDYLQIPGYSHSSLKMIKDGVQREFIPSDKVKVGKIVDAIRMGESWDLNDPLYPLAKDIAERIRVELGNATLNLLTSQVSYLGDMYDSESNLGIKIKGRPDWELGKLATIDLKVTFHPGKVKEDFIPLIEYMGYDNQLWNYKKLRGSSATYIFMYSVKAKKTFFFKRLDTIESNFRAESWWLDKILEYGSI